MSVVAPVHEDVRGVSVHLVGVVHLYPSPDGDVVALRGVDLDVESGKALALVGPSGAGKSTVLSLLAGEFAASAGVVRVGGHDLGRVGPEALARMRTGEISLVVQGGVANLLPYATAAENVWFAQHGARRRGAEITRSPQELLGLFAMERYAATPVEHLSAGERRRLALVTGVAVEPRLLLVDEPTSQLGARDRDEVVDTLVHIHEELGMTLVVVSHDIAVAARFERSVTIQDGRVGSEGRHGTNYAVVGRDGTVQLPPDALDLFPPDSLVRIVRSEGRVELLSSDLEGPGQ